MEEFFKVIHENGEIKEIYVDGEKVDHVREVTFRWSIYDREGLLSMPKMSLTFETINPENGDSLRITKSGWRGHTKTTLETV